MREGVGKLTTVKRARYVLLSYVNARYILLSYVNMTQFLHIYSKITSILPNLKIHIIFSVFQIEFSKKGVEGALVSPKF